MPSGFRLPALLALLALLLSAASPPALAARRSGTVELELTAPRTYRWNGQEYDYAAIGAALAEADAEKPIRKLVLLTPGAGATMADVIDFALLAKPIGAKAYHKVDGRLRGIEINLTPK